jgi:hypothetical protein
VGWVSSPSSGGGVFFFPTGEEFPWSLLESLPPVKVSPEGDSGPGESVVVEGPPPFPSFLPGFGFVTGGTEAPREGSGGIAGGLSPDAAASPPAFADCGREDVPEEPEGVDSFPDDILNGLNRSLPPRPAPDPDAECDSDPALLRGFFVSGGGSSPGGAGGSTGVGGAWASDRSGGGAGCSCSFSPITAPARHRNVQVTAIPILCSRFIRVLLSSDGLSQSFTAAQHRERRSERTVSRPR